MKLRISFLTIIALFLVAGCQNALLDTTTDIDGQSIQSKGTIIALKANANDKYVCAESGGSQPLIANRTAIGGWEKFYMETVSGSGQSPYGGSNWSIPGTVEAENYDNGGEGVACHDTTSGNNTGDYRSDDVDLKTNSGVTNVGWIENGEWLEYSVNVTSSGSYTIEAQVASASGGGSFSLLFNGSDKGTFSFDATEGWQSYTSVSKTGVSLNAGTQIMRLNAEDESWNIDNITISSDDPPPSSDSSMMINLAGVKYWSTDFVFTDYMKQADGWRANEGTISVDSKGWVTSLQSGQVATCYVMLDGTQPEGTYKIMWDGKGTFQLKGSDGNPTITATGSRSRDHYITGTDSLSIHITDTDPADYLRNIRVIAPG